MDTGTLLLVFVSEAVILALFVWFVRHSNQRLMQEIVGLEKQVKQVNDFVSHVSKSQKLLRQYLSDLAEESESASKKAEKKSPVEEVASLRAELAAIKAREK